MEVPYETQMEEEIMSGLFAALKGYKTYIMVAVGLIYTGLISLGLVPSQDWVWSLIGAGTIGSLRDALPKAPPQA